LREEEVIEEVIEVKIYVWEDDDDYDGGFFLEFPKFR